MKQLIPTHVEVAAARYRFPTTPVWPTRAITLAERMLSPLGDLIVRILLAQGFFLSGVLKLPDWNTALYLGEAHREQRRPAQLGDPPSTAVVTGFNAEGTHRARIGKAIDELPRGAIDSCPPLCADSSGRTSELWGSYRTKPLAR